MNSCSTVVRPLRSFSNRLGLEVHCGMGSPGAEDNRRTFVILGLQVNGQPLHANPDLVVRHEDTAQVIVIEANSMLRNHARPIAGIDVDGVHGWTWQANPAACLAAIECYARVVWPTAVVLLDVVAREVHADVA